MQLIKMRLTSPFWVEGCCFFFPCLGINEGRLGLGGGEGPRNPLLEATVGLRNVAEVIDGLSCEYDAVVPETFK